MTRARRLGFIGLAGLALALLALVAYRRSGLLGLPSVPSDLTAAEAGVDALATLRDTEAVLRGARPAANPTQALAAVAVAEIRAGRAEAGLAQLEQAVRQAPGDLALGNALRMQVFHQRRAFQLENDGAQGVMRSAPAWLEQRSIAAFRRLAREQPRRETRLQLAAALLDEMLLAPSLEVRAGVTFEALELLSNVLEAPGRGAYYLPARYARGLVYLYRPANLLWSDKIDAALQRARDDLPLCVAIARRVGLGAGPVGGRLALALGDTYAKEGRPSRARSWWQIADALTGAGALRARVLTRMAWDDHRMIDGLERELEAELRQVDQPLSDMSLLWP